MKTLKDSSFIEHEPCPKCHSKDNLARYSDGHAWCFGCGLFIPASQSSGTVVTRAVPNKVVSLPWDAKETVSLEAQHWLQRYGITLREMYDNGVRWSAARRQCIFPIKDDSNVVIAYAARNFDPKFDKWIIQGPKTEILHIIGLDNEVKKAENGIVLVEDIVSAIKVARVAPCMPLFGTTLDRRTLMRLARVTGRVWIWLDPDAKTKAAEMAALARVFGLDVRVIVSVRDPKESDEEDIKHRLERWKFV